MVNSITNTFIFITLLFTFSIATAADMQTNLKERQELALQIKQSNQNNSAKSTQNVVQKKKRKVVEETVLESKIGTSMGVAAWGEQILLQTGDGRRENILIQYTGFAFSLDYTLKGETIGWNTGVKAMYLQADAQAEGQSISYQNKSMAVYPIFLTTGLRFYPHEKVNVTINLGASFYELKFDPPTSVVTSYDFKYADVIQPIGQLQLGWMLSDSFILQQELFAVQKNDIAVGWIVSIGYVY